MAEAQKGIQATLFDYFQDTEYFTPSKRPRSTSWTTRSAT